MFTGIVEETGEVIASEDTEGGRRIRVEGSFTDDLSHGQSIAVNGCCLTVEEYGSAVFELFLSQETIERTYLGSIESGDHVNLERALPADGRFDGHITQGHVDATAEVTRIEQVGDDWTFGFSIPEQLGQYIVEKGSIAVDGISLTVADRQDGGFTAAIIPATYELTNLSDKQVGDPVHIEVDVLAKYVERMLADQDSDNTDTDTDIPLP
jgi:riboflavin synthase